MKRVVANIYEDTRELLDNVKSKYDFKSDDQTVRFLCEMFIADDRAKVLEHYVAIKVK